MANRKAHVSVPQAHYAEALAETGGGLLNDIAEHFDVSTTTARRQLDGLVAQGKLSVEPGPQGRWYNPPCCDCGEAVYYDRVEETWRHVQPARPTCWMTFGNGATSDAQHCTVCGATMPGSGGEHDHDGNCPNAQ